MKRLFTTHPTRNASGYGVALFVAVLIAALLALPAPALADHLKGETNWRVTYNSAGRMEDNYSSKDWADNMSKLEPGDDITFEVEMVHENDTDGDWYFSNEVLKSLEEGEAKGSAYGYKLAYEGPSNSRELYNSQVIGGSGSTGLLEATDAMDDYFFLGTLKKGEKGKVTLNVSLDGETEGNAYFDTLAQLQLNFAVEPQTNPEKKYENREEIKEVEQNQVINRTVSGGNSNITLAKTGDETSNLPLYLVLVGVGIVLLAIAIRNVRSRKEDSDEQ